MCRTSLSAVVGVVMGVFAIAPGASAAVDWVFSDANQKWVSKGPVQESSTPPSGTVITIMPDSLKQEILGFGGCFNEKGWVALSVLSTAGRDSVMRALFDTSGCAFNYCRMPIGASDYAVSAYSLDDSAGDYDLTHFSIARDQLRLIPFIKAALAVQPSLSVWGAAWAIPGWMMNSSVFCTPKMYTSLALYYEKYVLAYRAEGIPVVAVHTGNEPCGGGGGVNTVYSAQQMHDLIGSYLGPKLKQDNVNVEIWHGDLNCNYDPFMSSVLDDPTCAQYVTGTGVQYTGRGSIGTLRSRHPEKKIMQTETECFSGTNSWEDGNRTAVDMFSDFGAGVSAYMQWNMVLDETGANFTTGWRQNAMVTVNKTTGAVAYNPQFYCVKHFSRFVKKGARMCKVNGAPWNNAVVAFVNPDASVVIVVQTQTAGSIAFKMGAQSITVNLTPGMSTFVWRRGTSTATTMRVSASVAKSERMVGRTLVGLGTMRGIRCGGQALFDIRGKSIKGAAPAAAIVIAKNY